MIPSGTVTCFSSLRPAPRTNDQGATTDCGSPPPVFVQASISVPAPLLFWSLLPGGEIADDHGRIVRSRGDERAAVHGMRDRAGRRADAGPGARPIWWIGVRSRQPLHVLLLVHRDARLRRSPGPAVPYVILNRVDPDLDESDQMFRQAHRG